LLDWRLTRHADVDHAHPMEPPVAGGAKIAEAVTRVVFESEFGRGRMEVVLNCL
jgi:hypothetical protein